MPSMTCIHRRSRPCCNSRRPSARWTYWSRSDAHAMVINLGGNAKARAGLCRVIERWIGHLLGVAVSVETVPSIEDRDWRWFIGLDSDATRIGNALWRGERLESRVA